MSMEQKQPDKFLRYERKYIIEKGYSYIFSNFLKDNFFKKAYEPRFVNSIYFDNLEYESFSNNLDGVSNRKKTRLRWYDEKKIPLNLEIKLKKNMMNTKNIKFQGKFLNINKLEKFLKKKFTLFFSKVEQPKLPVLKIRYFRNYFISSCKNYRATIDSNITVSDIYGSFIFGKEINLNNDVLEFKYESSKDQEFRKESFLKKNFFRLQKNSKYVTGLISLNESGIK